MGISSTRLKIAFFSFLLVGIIIIQYCWVLSLQKEKLQEYKSRVITSIERTGKKIPFLRSKYALTESELASMLQQSFFSNGLGEIRFEFSIGSGNDHLASSGFTEKLEADPNNLFLVYEMSPYGDQGDPANQLTVIMPFWKKIALKDMTWVIATAVFIIIITLAIFCCAVLLGERRQQLFYNHRSKAIQLMMQQLETPLSTVAIAAEVLRNASVMHDPRKSNYYHQVINEESQRMNEQVEKFLRELK
jgi:signal transduction histidine kinase